MKRSISIPTDTLWQAGFLLLAPLTAAWLMQFTYGVLPWAMPFPALLANALCIALLYWPLCGLTGRIAPCCIGIHIAAGAWGAANCFVQSFRGTPILPWDLSALGTAADVAGSYRFTPTWQMLAAVALAAGPGCVPPSGETQGPPAPHRNAAAPAAGVPGGGAGLPPAPVPHRAAGAFRC